MKRILVVDDELHVREFLREVLEAESYEVAEAQTTAEVYEVVRAGPFTLIILDLMLPDGHGLDILDWMSTERISIPVIVITAVGTISTAVDSIKKGAFDFITKPFDLDTIKIAVERAIGFAAMSVENEALRRQRDNSTFYDELIGESSEIRRIKDAVLRLSHPDVPILISGETGTGKNILAKQIHFTWSAASAALVHANCAGIPEHLFESELFGYEKGAFTGATTTKRGLAEVANGGTLILDEISEMPNALQVKLLHLIQERSFYRLGGTSPVQATTRIIALTNRDLDEECRLGNFRRDLFYRLNVVHLRIPPLRERGEDALLLAEGFLSQLRYKYDQPNKRLSSECRSYILSSEWPGNVRELKNQLERAFIFSDDEFVRVGDLGDGSPALNAETAGDGGLRSRVLQFERRIIAETVERHSGNKTAAAAELGISVRNLHYKLSE